VTLIRTPTPTRDTAALDADDGGLGGQDLALAIFIGALGLLLLVCFIFSRAMDGRKRDKTASHERILLVS
jgi:hypothetical protein